MATGGKERNELTLMWRIDSFSCYQRDYHTDRIKSPVFNPRTLKCKDTDLGLHVSDENVSLNLFISSCLPVDCEFSLLARDESPLFTSVGINDSEDEFQIFRMKDCPTLELLFGSKKSSFLPNDTLTVRCRVWKYEGNFQHPEFILGRTRIDFAEDSMLSASRSNNRDSYHFKLKTIHEFLNFDLKYLIEGDSLQNSILIITINHGTTRIKYLVKLEVSVLDRNRREVMKHEKVEESSCASETSWVLREFKFREHLREGMSLLKWDQGLFLVFRLTAFCCSNFIERSCYGISNGTGTSPEASRQTSGRNCLDVLVEDFFSLYQNQEFSDFELRSEGVFFPVHKVVLSARSPVFRSMFSSEMMESNSNSVDVPDVDADTLERMIAFLYTGTVESDLTYDSAADLYYAADKYQVDSLKDTCYSMLQSQISISNACDLLILADRHQDSDLTTLAHDFILNNLDHVLHSREWEEFLDDEPVLAGKLTIFFCRKRLERNSSLRT